MDPVIEGTSAAAAEYKEIEGTSAAKDPPMDEILAAEHKRPISLLMDWLVKVEETSDTESTENGERTYWPKNSIFRVPDHIRSGRESNFEPKLVSIGSYYRGEENVQRVQHLKIRCIQEILKMLGIAARRTNHPRTSKARNPTNNQSRYAMSAPKNKNRKLQDKTVINDEFLRQFMFSGREARAYYKEEFHH